MFKKLFGKKKEESSADSAVKLSPAIREAIFRTAGSSGLPTMPGAAQKAFQLSTDPKAESSDFTAVIEADEGLSARVLKIANSVFYDRGTKTETISEAVIRMGMEELRNLLSATTLSAIFPSRSPLRRDFWAHDIACAFAAKKIALKVLPEKAETAFLAGLMHDIGKLFMLQKAESDYMKVIAHVKHDDLEFCQAEEDVFVFNHCEAGQVIAERWNFPEDLIQTIRLHHSERQVSEEHEVEAAPTLPDIIRVADMLCHSNHLGSASFISLQNRYNEELTKELHKLGISAPEQKTLINEIVRHFEMERTNYESA